MRFVLLLAFVASTGDACLETTQSQDYGDCGMHLVQVQALALRSQSEPTDEESELVTASDVKRKAQELYSVADVLMSITFRSGELGQQVSSSGQSVVLILVFVSVSIVVLLIMLVLSDAAYEPYEIQPTGPAHRGGVSPANSFKNSPASSGRRGEPERSPFLVDRPVPGARSEAATPSLERPVPPPRSYVESRAQPASQPSVCFNCRNRFLDDAPFCSTCGTRRPVVEAPDRERENRLLKEREFADLRRGPKQTSSSSGGRPSTEGPRSSKNTPSRWPVIPEDSPPASEQMLMIPPVRRSPDLCPWLVLSAESCFVVPVEELMMGVGNFALLGLSGQRLLRGSVVSKRVGRVIEVSMPPARSPMLASIGVSQSPDAPAGSLEVRGGGRSTEDRAAEYHYGWLSPSTNGGYLLTSHGAEVLSLFGDGDGYKVYSQGGDAGSAGTMAAKAAKCTEANFDGEHLQVTVYAHVDAVLVICVVLAVVLFGGGEELPTPGNSSTNLT